MLFQVNAYDAIDEATIPVDGNPANGSVFPGGSPR